MSKGTTDPRAIFAEELPAFGPKTALYSSFEAELILDGLLGDSPALGGEPEVSARLAALR